VKEKHFIYIFSPQPHAINEQTSLEPERCSKLIYTLVF